MPTSRTISGITCLAATCAPLVLAPMQIGNSLGFVREMENRTPNPFPPLTAASNLLDSTWWAHISSAIEDRTPFRKQMISLERMLNLSGSTGLASRTIAFGQGDWLFWHAALAKDLGSMEYVEQAIDAMETFEATNSFNADLFILAAPDKATIYPEKLIDSSRAIYEPSLPQRDRLHSWFAQPNQKSRLDIWSAMHQRKSQLNELIYEKMGSHYNSIGAMVMARAMIDAVDNSLWDDSELIDLWTKTINPELAQRGGEWNRTETYTRSQIKRLGVNIVALYDEDRLIENPKFLSIQDITYHNHKRIISESATREMIVGKTLIIHDSFIAVYLYPTLSQFFNDITFIHVGYITPKEFRAALDTYDRVYFQIAEHYFPERAIEYFSRAGESAP